MGYTKYDPETSVLNYFSRITPEIYNNQKDGLIKILKFVKPEEYRNISGWVVYFFVNKFYREIDYIGITRNLSRRMSSHNNLSKQSHDVVIIKVGEKEASVKLEKCLINDFCPRLNICK